MPSCPSCQNNTTRTHTATPIIGDAYDNALAETINGLYKTEVIRRRGPWRNIEAVEFATLEWVHWVNNKRLLEPIGWTNPVEYEKAYCCSHTAREKAA